MEVVESKTDLSEALPSALVAQRLPRDAYQHALDLMQRARRGEHQRPSQMKKLRFRPRIGRERSSPRWISAPTVRLTLTV